MARLVRQGRAPVGTHQEERPETGTPHQTSEGVRWDSHFDKRGPATALPRLAEEPGLRRVHVLVRRGADAGDQLLALAAQRADLVAKAHRSQQPERGTEPLCLRLEDPERREEAEAEERGRR